jgi:hypothetical protein
MEWEKQFWRSLPATPSEIRDRRSRESVCGGKGVGKRGRVQTLRLAMVAVSFQPAESSQLHNIA